MVVASTINNSDRSVFIVDDSEDIRDLFGLLAEQNGFVLECASDGVEGLAKLAKLKLDPAIVLVDLNMPSMGGSEFVRKVHENGLAQTSRIVILSAEERTSISMGRLDKSIEWMKKPFRVADVMRVINKARSN